MIICQIANNHNAIIKKELSRPIHLFARVACLRTTAEERPLQLIQYFLQCQA